MPTSCEGMDLVALVSAERGSDTCLGEEGRGKVVDMVASLEGSLASAGQSPSFATCRLDSPTHNHLSPLAACSPEKAGNSDGTAVPKRHFHCLIYHAAIADWRRHLAEVG